MRSNPNHIGDIFGQRHPSQPFASAAVAAASKAQSMSIDTIICEEIEKMDIPTPHAMPSAMRKLSSARSQTSSALTCRALPPFSI